MMQRNAFIRYVRTYPTGGQPDRKALYRKKEWNGSERNKTWPLRPLSTRESIREKK